MHKKLLKLPGFFFMLVLSQILANAQISPGDLSSPHSHLEGMSNCTKCHVLGNKVSNEKCLACHTEIQERLTLNRGFHNSGEVKGKQCTVCHSDHNGKNFQLVHFDTQKFDHNLSGYILSVPHAKKQCKDCHDTKFIADKNIRSKKFTYLGVNTQCLNCHDDYHNKTLSPDCSNCHNADAFKPASRFKHSNTKFQLIGKHATVDCLKCHKVEVTEGKKNQDFRLEKHSDCADCHKDPHQNKFGQNCSQCHNEQSFQIVVGVKKFDHNKTDYKLTDKHLMVNCKACHKTRFTDPLKFKRCTDCHSDYHTRQFAKNGISPDCSQCHSLKGFNFFKYSTEQHNQTTFPLNGGHLAIPCFECHKKQPKWNFRSIGIKCKECHKDIHQPFVPIKYYPDGNCKICHVENRWTNVAFDHSKTKFQLNGMHLKQNCRTCHITSDSKGTALKDSKGFLQQKFTGLPINCSGCHNDIHYKQFEKNGYTSCTDCHDTEKWKDSKFDHNSTAFKLDGKHINIPCMKCHKPQQNGSNFYIKYKLKEFRCESCHS